MSGFSQARLGADQKPAQGSARSMRAAEQAPGNGALAQLKAGSDRSPTVERLRSLQQMANDRPGQVGALRTPGGPAVQRMTVGNKKKLSSVSGTTLGKHVKATGDQEAAAKGNFGGTTFVTSAAALTGAVDANAHNFPSSAKRSDREDITADLAIYQWDKTAQPGTEGFKKGGDVQQSIAGASHSCEIGAEKTGADEISITHFKKL